jgi:hypothetical protein
MVLFRLLSSVDLDPVQKWGSRKNQTKIATEQCLISIIWSINGIHNLLDVPKWITYNITFFCDVIV